MRPTMLSGSALILLASSLVGTAVATPFWKGKAAANAQSSSATSSATSSASSSAAVSLTTSSIATPAATPSANPASGSTATGAQLVEQLLTAGTAVERYKLLTAEDFAYDFNNPPAGAITKGDGGHTVKADRLTFPALVGNGVSMTVGFLGPCGFNTPHTHPRSAEFNIVVQGMLSAQFIAENGATIVNHNATQYQAIIFPQGAVHTEFNPTCEQAVFVAGFGNEDPGVQQSVQTFFGLGADVIAAALGTDGTFAGQDIEKFKSLVPANVAKGVESCLATCGIKKRDLGA